MRIRVLCSLPAMRDGYDRAGPFIEEIDGVLPVEESVKWQVLAPLDNGLATRIFVEVGLLSLLEPFAAQQPNRAIAQSVSQRPVDGGVRVRQCVRGLLVREEWATHHLLPGGGKGIQWRTSLTGGTGKSKRGGGDRPWPRRHR